MGLGVEFSKVLDALFQKFFSSKLKNIKERESVRVGDTVVAYIKIVLKDKVQKRMTAAQKQALKQDLAAGKTMEEIMEARLKAQPFRGVVIAIKGKGKNKMLVIRKISSHNVAVERIVPLYSPVLDRLEIIKRGKPRRAKLYYLRKRTGRKALAVKSVQ